MSSDQTAAPRRRRRFGAIGLAVLIGASGALVTAVPSATPAGAAVPLPFDSGSVTWGVKQSFRTYIVGPIAHGTIETSGGATINSPSGTYTFPDGSGTVHFAGHDGQLDLTITDPRVVFAGSSAQLVVDVVSLPFGSPTPVTYDDLAIADINLAAASPTTAVDGSTTWTDVPTTITAAGVPVFMNYAAGDALDPVSFTGTWDPQLSFSKTTDINPNGETITVTGAGYNPLANTGTRPPLSGQKSGFYVVFGKFANVWQPSLGTATAPSSTRQSLNQKWALPSVTYNAQNPDGTNPDFVLISPNGTFTATLFVSKAIPLATPAQPNYGIVTYGGSGANNASQEKFVPVSFSTTPGLASGKVADAGGDGVPGARVIFYDSVTNAKVVAATASSKGNYAKALPPGKYKAEFKAPGFQTSFSGGSSTLASAAVITVNPGLTTAVPTVTLQESITVEGTVTTQQTGLPVHGARVTLLNATTGVEVAAGVTDASGNYLIKGVQPGSYKVYFKGGTIMHKNSYGGSGGQTLDTAEVFEVFSGATEVDGVMIAKNAYLAVPI